MVAITPSYKYQVQSGYVVISNIQATDAGFYTCSSRCDQVTYDQLNYYLQPTTNGVPIDTSQNWIAIPANALDDNTNRQRYYVVVSDEGSGQIYGSHSGLSVGEIIGLVVGVALAVLITLAIIIVLCILNKRRKRRNQEKINTGRKEEKDTSSVDYSTIERDYASSAGNTLTSTRDGNQLVDGEINSLAANKARTNDINTRGIAGPGTYRPNDYSTGSNRGGAVLDLPNIDINYQDKKTASNRSQMKVQFPDRPNIDARPRYVSSNENIHLQQIAQDPSLMPNMLDDDYDRNHPYQFNNQNLSADDPESEGGGVTVVSARTPARLDQQLKQQQQYQQLQQPPKAYVNQNQPPPPKQYPGLSMSHRIETTSTPLQIPTSSASLRNGGNNSMPLRQASLNKDGATDV